jgi:hypothetical protein
VGIRLANLFHFTDEHAGKGLHEPIFAEAETQSKITCSFVQSLVQATNVQKVTRAITSYVHNNLARKSEESIYFISFRLDD